MDISNYLNDFLNKMSKKLGYNEFHKLCEDIILQKDVKGLDQYPRKLLAIELEKMIMMCVERNRLATDHESYFKTLELQEPLINNYSKVLIAYIKLFIATRDSLMTNKDLEVVENYYNAIIYNESKKFENKMMTLPGGKKVCLGDLGVSIENLMNKPSTYDLGINVKKTNKKAPKAIIIGAVIAEIALITLAKSPIIEEPKKEVKEEVVEENPEDVYETLQQLDILGIGYNFMSEEETEEYKETAMEVVEEQYKSDSNEQTNQFVGYTLDLGDEDKNYEAFLKQRFLYELCKKEGVDFNRAMTIWHRESDGHFNNDGKESPSADLGEMQINRCNLKVLNEEFGYTEDDIQNDWMKNMIASVYLMKGISKKYDATDDRNFFGCYNGWTDWEKKPLAIEYSKGSLKLKQEIYNKTDEELLAPVNVYEENMEGSHGRFL